MGTTDRGIPFPESDDFVKDGATAMQALAEAVDERIGGALLRATVANEGIADDVDDVLNLNKTTGDSDLFDDSGAQIEYTGPDSVVALVVQVAWEADAAGTRRVAIQVNGSTEVYEKNTPDGGTEQHVMVVPWLTKLETGDEIGVSVRQTSGSSLDVVSGKLRCVVLGV